jgi:hypothetical protein
MMSSLENDELVGNPALVEYYGVPINEAARGHGDIFVTTSYPYIDIENGGGIEGEIDMLNGAPQES